MALAEAKVETLDGLPRRKSSGLLAGSITEKSDLCAANGCFAYAGAQPHAVSSIAGTIAGVTNPNYFYDSNGNLRCMTALAQCDTGAAKTVAWTWFNMVSSVQQGTTNVSLLYDEGHARLQQSAPEGVTQYLNDPTNGVMTERFAPTGGGLYWRSYIQADGHIVAERSVKGSTVTVRYFTLDHLGSTIALTDETGHLAESDAYDAWGKARDATTGADDPTCSKPGQSFTTRGFSGHEEMADLCLVNMNARIYDPTIGRFMSPDDIIPDAADGQSYNRYSYVDNNPLSYEDPTGHVEVGNTTNPFNYASAVRNNDSCTGDCDSDEDRAMEQTLQNMAVAGAVGTAIAQATGQSPSGISVQHMGGIYLVTAPGFTFASADGSISGGSTFAFAANDGGQTLAIQIKAGNADVGSAKSNNETHNSPTNNANSLTLLWVTKSHTLTLRFVPQIDDSLPGKFGILTGYWQLSEPAPEDGIILQHVVAQASIEFENGTTVQRPENFFETWNIAKGHTETSRTEKGYPYDDTFEGDQITAHGSIAISLAEARFYPGQKVPSGFQKNNFLTLAHGLPSSTSDPRLPTDGATPSVERTWSYHW